MIQKTVDGSITLFFYNLEDRLERVEDGTGTIIARYGYDPFGRRIWKEISGTKTYYLYSDEGLIGEYDQAGTEIKTYGWKPGNTWGTDPLFMKIGSEYYFYHNDHLGTPQKMTAVNGAVVWSAKYSSFGKAEIDPASTVENNLRLAGQYEDTETGLHFNFHRYYNAKTGRYLIPDPIKFEGGMNFYLYVNNRPLKFIDPYGLAEECSDCPGGKWDVDVHGNVNLVVFMGGSRSRVTFTCLSNNKKCSGVLNCAAFGVGADISIGYSFESHGEEGETLGTGTVIYDYFSNESIEQYHSSETIISGGIVGTSGNNVNPSVGFSLFVGKQFCTTASIVCDD
ncbi:MAG: hypothetical protein GY865_00690 [candidate division Zixibacteria bacterium]|nr:hypothetical protein [candidate division Zixibacteria bacterium]